MIQVSLFQSSHRASWSYHRLGLGVFDWLCLESFGIGFLDTKRHLRPFAWAKKIDTNERNESKPERGEGDPQRLSDGCMPVFSRPFLKRFERFYSTKLTRNGLIGSTLLPDQKVKLKRSVVTRSICITPQVAQARYMSSSMLHCYVIRAICIFKKICIGKEINPKNTIKTAYLNSSAAFFVCCVIV